jgi:Flp pilus assembly protein TadB
MSTPPGGGFGRRARLDRLPAPAIFVLTAAILFGIGAGTRLLDHDVDATYLVLRGVTALVIAGLTTWRFVRTRRSVGGAAGFTMLRTALKTGDLPPDVPLNGWREELDRRERTLRRNRWYVPVLCGVLALFGVFIVLTAGHGAAAGWLLVAIAVVLGAVALIRTEQVLPRIESLRSQLDARR